jgi:fructan beta-fructosidase
MVKLWRPGNDIAVHQTPIVEGRTYHLTVRTDGPRIRVWLDNGTDPVIDATDGTYPSGRFGINAYNGNTTTQNARIS